MRNIGISQENAAVVQALSKILADEFVLSTKTLNAHWNLEGPDFYSMHRMFEVHHRELFEIIDKIAERIRMLGHYAPATLKQILQLTHLTEKTRERNDSKGFLKELLNDHESIAIHIQMTINHLEDQYKDASTNDLLTSLVTYHEKLVWILRSHLV